MDLPRCWLARYRRGPACERLRQLVVAWLGGADGGRAGTRECEREYRQGLVTVASLVLLAVEGDGADGGAAAEAPRPSQRPLALRALDALVAALGLAPFYARGATADALAPRFRALERALRWRAPALALLLAHHGVPAALYAHGMLASGFAEVLPPGDALLVWDLLLASRALAAGRCLLYTSPSPRDGLLSRMPSSA